LNILVDVRFSNKILLNFIYACLIEFNSMSRIEA